MCLKALRRSKKGKEENYNKGSKSGYCLVAVKVGGSIFCTHLQVTALMQYAQNVLKWFSDYIWFDVDQRKKNSKEKYFFNK